MQIRYGDRNKKRDQSLAQQFCNRFKHTKDLAALKLKMQGRSISCVKHGDDYLHTMSDHSKLLQRVIVGEWQLFDTRTLEITEDIAKIAMLKYPQIAARMRLSSSDRIVYSEIIKGKRLGLKELVGLTGFATITVRLSLLALRDKGYIYREKANISGRHRIIYHAVL